MIYTDIVLVFRPFYSSYRKLDVGGLKKGSNDNYARILPYVKEMDFSGQFRNK